MLLFGIILDKRMECNMIRLENVSKYYHNEGIVTLGLRKINLEFNVGEFIALTGESGSGKSTLLNVISGIDSYEDGELYINKEETSHFDDNDWEGYRRDSVGFIFQNYNLIDSYTVLKNVEVALVIQGVDRAARKARAKEIIEKVGLTSHLKHRASKLSGGQKQRLAIARALAKDTQIIVADEPTGNLDSESGDQILKLLNEVSKDKLVIIVTHNFQQAEPFVTRKVRLYDGEVVEDKRVKNVEEQEEKPLIKETKTTRFSQIATVSRFNLISQPRKTILLLLVCFVSIFFIFSAYGSYLSTNNLRGGGGGGSMYQINDYKERVIVTRKDQQPLTDADYQYLSSLKRVDLVIKEDLILDMRLDTYIELNSQYNQLSFYGRLDVIGDFKSEDLIGRLPTSPDEVLISSNIYSNDIEELKSVLNREINLNYSMNDFSHNSEPFKIVGFHLSNNYETKFYFNRDTLDTFNNQTKISAAYTLDIDFGEYKQLYNNILIKVDKDLKDNEIIFSGYLVPEGIDLSDIKIHYAEQLMTLVAVNDSEIEYKSDHIFVSEEFFNQIKIEEDYQYTINLKDYKDSESVINDLYDKDYYAFSPYNSRPFDMDGITLLMQKIFSFISTFFLLFVVYLISYLIIKTIMNSKKRDYTILRTIGIQKSSIKQIIRFEIVACFIIAYPLFLIVYSILIAYHPAIFKPLIEDYKISDYIIITLLNLVIALLISRKFNKLLTKKNLLSDLKAGE